MQESQVLREIHDKVDTLVTDVNKISVHLEYLKDSRATIIEEIEDLEGRVDTLEDIETKRAGSHDVWKWGVSIVLVIMAIMEGLDAWKNFVN